MNIAASKTLWSLRFLSTILYPIVKVPAIVKLTASNQADVRLAVAEILASLSIAPHTRAAVIDNNGLEFLVNLLLNYSDEDGSWDGQGPTTLAVGNALLQLSAGAMANSNKWRRTSETGQEDYSERAGVIEYVYVVNWPFVIGSQISSDRPLIYLLAHSCSLYATAH